MENYRVTVTFCGITNKRYFNEEARANEFAKFWNGTIDKMEDLYHIVTFIHNGEYLSKYFESEDKAIRCAYYNNGNRKEFKKKTPFYESFFTPKF